MNDRNGVWERGALFGGREHVCLRRGAPATLGIPVQKRVVILCWHCWWLRKGKAGVKTLPCVIEGAIGMLCETRRGSFWTSSGGFPLRLCPSLQLATRITLGNLSSDILSVSLNIAQEDTKTKERGVDTFDSHFFPSFKLRSVSLRND